VCTSLDDLHRLVEENLESRLTELNVRATVRASKSDLAYDSAFFRKVGDAAVAGIKYPQLEEVSGWQGVDGEGRDAVEKIRDELRKTTPVPDSLQDYVIALKNDRNELDARLKMSQSEKDKAVQEWEKELRLSAERRKRFATERTEAARQLEAAMQKYNAQIAEMKAIMNKAEESAKNAWAERAAAEESRKKGAAELQDRISRLENEVMTLQEELDKKGALEVAVNEGRVLQVDVVDGRAIISLGRREKVSAGEKFTVMRPGKGGQLMPKGELQVVRVDELVSRADILSVEADDTILRDDVVVRVNVVD